MMARVDCNHHGEASDTLSGHRMSDLVACEWSEHQVSDSPGSGFITTQHYHRPPDFLFDNLQNLICYGYCVTYADPLHSSSHLWDRRGTSTAISHCKTTSSFNLIMVNVFDNRYNIFAVQSGVGHNLVEIERRWRIVSRSSLLWVHICTQLTVMNLNTALTSAPVNAGLGNLPIKFHSFYVQNRSLFDMPPSPEVDDAWQALYDSSCQFLTGVPFGSYVLEAAIRLTKDEAAKLPNTTLPIQGASGGYLGALYVFHQLHCLVSFVSSRHLLITHSIPGLNSSDALFQSLQYNIRWFSYSVLPLWTTAVFNVLSGYQRSGLAVVRHSPSSRWKNGCSSFL